MIKKLSLITLFLSLPLTAFAEDCPYLASQLENYKAGQDISKFMKSDCLADNAKWQIKETPIIWAVTGMNKCQGNLDAVRAMLTKEPSLATSYDYEHKYSALAHSISSCCGNYNYSTCGKNPQYDIAKLLIDNGADVNAKAKNIYDSYQGQSLRGKEVNLLDMVRIQMSNNPSCNNSSLENSSDTCKQIEELLLQNGAVASVTSDKATDGNKVSFNGGNNTCFFESTGCLQQANLPLDTVVLYDTIANFAVGGCMSVNDIMSMFIEGTISAPFSAAQLLDLCRVNIDCSTLVNGGLMNKTEARSTEEELRRQCPGFVLNYIDALVRKYKK